MKGQVLKHVWDSLGGVRGGGGKLQHLAILPRHYHFILFIKFILLPINPYISLDY